MAFAEIELARVKKVVGGFCDSRTNPEIRDKLRYEYSVQRHDVVIHEVRPHWRNWWRWWGGMSLGASSGEGRP